jgi:hypothetical protein
MSLFCQTPLDIQEDKKMESHNFNNNLYGVDVAINAETGLPVLHELNGICSGMKGFRKLDLREQLDNNLADRIIKIADDKPIIMGVAQRALYKILKNKGTNVSKINPELPLTFGLEKKVNKCGFIYGSDPTLQSSFFYWTDKKGHQNKCANPLLLEWLVGSKLSQQVLLEKSEVSDSIPEGVFICNGESNWQEYVETSGHDTFVYKPLFGCQGRGIEILNREEALKVLEKDSILKTVLKTVGKIFTPIEYDQCSAPRKRPKALLQKFVKSKPVYCAETGNYHSASARIIHFNGAIEGYWRLSPKAVDDPNASEETKHVVNLSREGLAAPMSDKDKEILFPYADKVIAAFESQAKDLTFSSIKHFYKFRNDIYQALVEDGKVRKLTDYISNKEGPTPMRVFG